MNCYFCKNSNNLTISYNQLLAYEGRCKGHYYFYIYESYSNLQLRYDDMMITNVISNKLKNYSTIQYRYSLPRIYLSTDLIDVFSYEPQELYDKLKSYECLI